MEDGGWMVGKFRIYREEKEKLQIVHDWEPEGI